MSGEPRKTRMDSVNADSTGRAELVLDLVMSYLPVKDCVRTSILSSGWRYRWTTIPSLVFDSTCYPRPRSYRMEEGKAFVSIVNHVLSRHNGSIQVFEAESPCIVPGIDFWVSRVFTNSIKTLVLRLCYSKQYTLPSSLFTCESLSCLKLNSCSLMTPPSSFKGFKNLTCLELKHVTLTNDALEKLISPCPLLENLTLVGIKEADSLEINAPNLRDVSIVGDFVNITFGYEMTKLSVINILATHISAAECVYPSLVDLFIKLPNIRLLQLDDCDIGFMFGDSTQDGFPFHCKDLYCLAISMALSFPLDDLPTLYLCRDRQEMEALAFQAWRDDSCYLAIEVGAWEDDDGGEWDYDFRRLQSVTMDNFRGTSAELKFAEYVLRNSPVLEEVIVNPSDEITWGDITSVYELWRPPRAKVILGRRLTQTC